MSRFVRTFRSRKIFLDCLAAGDSISKAAMAAGATTSIMKRWRADDANFAADWDEAMSEAQDLVSSGTDGAIDELMEQPMLASVLDAGLAAFDLSCNGIGEVS